MCVYIYIYLLLLSTFESNTIVETLCYWLMLGKKNAICTLCCTPISHLTFQPSYHIKTEITFLEIQICSHFS